MIKIFLCSVFLTIIINTSVFSQTDAIVGKWLTQNKEAKIEIYKSNDTYYGKIIWLKDPNDPKTGRPMIDSKNKDKSKRSLPILGSKILRGFKYAKGEYVNGSVYDGRSGKIYTGKLWLENNNKLKMRGYLGVFYKTEIWKRIE